MTSSPRFRLLLLAATVAASCVLHSRPVSGDSCCLKVDTASRQFVDTQGRARLFHGVNVVYKSFPYYPRNDTFDPSLSLSEEDVTFLIETGFNVVRLYVAWPGLEPKKGEYNMTYLEVIVNIVERLGKAGIYTILDCHQDLLSPKFCGEGVPDYAALYLNRSETPLPFPMPIPSLTAYKLDPETGYPYRNECTKHAFFSYYFCDAEGAAWQSLYNNEQGILDRFGLFWGKVAQRFKDNPYVLGYEIINEPWAGDIYKHPDQLETHIADRRNLMPMYQKMHDIIRKYDNNHIIFFEPTVIISSLPLKGISSTGLTEGPGGEAYNDRQVFSYHVYCILLDADGQPRSIGLCDAIDDDVLKIRMSDTEKLGVNGFLTEWGAYSDETVPGSKPYEEGLELTALADKYLQSWSYWQYKGYGDFTTQSSSSDEGLWYANGTLQSSKVKLLTRTYAQAVSGRYVSQEFNPSTSDFTLSFAANTTLSQQPTLIYLNEKFYYPNGYSVSVSPADSASYTTTHNLVKVMLQPAHVKTGDIVSVKIQTKS